MDADKRDVISNNFKRCKDMNKTSIKVPKGIEYLSQIEDFELPNGILNKGIPNCGATTLALEDRHKTIICSPRNNLLINKHEQYPDTLLVIDRFREDAIREYIATTDCPKILVSYDSLPKVKKCIAEPSEWRVVADEFQYLLSDGTFKSEVEMRLLAQLQSFDYVTYLSATPIIDTYLEQIDEFKDIPYYEMLWQDVEKVKVIRLRSKRPIDSAIEVINSYKRGAFPQIKDNGEVLSSKECVIFLNSVDNIIKLIAHTKLKPEEVNIIVGNSSDNDAKIAKLDGGFARGRIPLKGESHKMFTFCTSTAFAGCDFYSTNATTVVISDNKRVNTTIDIATDLVQIAGRQRLAENPFRKYLLFIYNVGACEKSKDEFERELAEKKQLTEAEIESNNACSGTLRQKRIKDTTRLQKMLKFDESFTMYDELIDRFIFNQIAYLGERYAFDLQKYNYENGIVIRNQLQDSNFDISTNQRYLEYEEQLTHVMQDEPFADRMERYCNYRSNRAKFDLTAQTLAHKYPELPLYFEELGEQRIKALGYKEKDIRDEIKFRHNQERLKAEMQARFPVGDRLYSSTEIRTTMNEVFERFGHSKKGKITDLEELYKVQTRLVKPTLANGVRKNLYKVVAHLL